MMKKILCGYDKTTRPYSADNPLIVAFNMRVKSFEYVGSKLYKFNILLKKLFLSFQLESSFSLSIESEIALKWQDDRFKWNSEEFKLDNISLVSTEDIWLPDIIIHNQ